ncbi:MAG: PLP-dependent aminotransferase family protein [Pseudomonadota bacterium]
MLVESIAARLDRSAAATLSGQVYDVIRQLILDEALKAGQRLPSSRQLAADLAIARNTVIDAFAQLSDEGYLESRIGAGSFVARTLPEARMHAEPGAQPGARPGVPPGVPPPTRAAMVRNAALSRRALAVLAEPAIMEGGAFAPSMPDLTHFPFELWQRLVSKAWRGVRASDTRYASNGGHPDLRMAIAEHVQLARQVRCNASQVIVVNGAQHGLDLCARLLADAGERVWVEDPGYPGARRAFRAADLELVPVPLDDEGMAPAARHHRRAPRLIYLTPSHQFPTGTVMSLQRRRALLDVAARHRSWIIEDDYDGEFRFSGRPIASLQGIDPAQRVIYVGTFSKAMFPGLRLGYLVVPESISQRFADAAAMLAFEGRQVTQAALAAFMREGHFSAHIRRMRLLYGERRALLEDVWRHELGEMAPLGGGDTGIHMVAQLPLGTDVAISAQAREAGIIAQSLHSLYLGRPDRAGLVLGYGAMHERAIRQQGVALARIVQRALA